MDPRSLGVLAGTFHPVTRAHLALAHAALRRVDEVLFVMPRKLPHKEYEQVPLAARMELVVDAIRDEPRFSAAITEGGLFIEIARELRALHPAIDKIWFLCGRDAAERIVEWDYGRPNAFAAMLDEFGLLVAERQGVYRAPEKYAHRIEELTLAGEWSEVSATEVRERIASGRPWEHLVPEQIIDRVRRLY